MFNIYLALPLALIVLSWIGHLLEYKHILFIHESSVGISIGIMIGAIGRFMFDAVGVDELEDEFFFNVLLPPIIFSAAYSLKKKSFFDNFGAVMVYGILATLLTFGVIFLIIHEASKLGWFLDLFTSEAYNLNFRDCLQVAAIFSSTDSVSALSILHPKEFPTLHSILAGEGIINDGMSIIVFNIVLHFIQKDSDMNPAGFITIQILLLTLGSAFVGVLVGLANALFIKYQPHEPQVVRDMCIVFLFAYTAYEISEVCILFSRKIIISLLQ
jgi:NhaP-type Na+/H+ or K+/H+ antiporter